VELATKTNSKATDRSLTIPAPNFQVAAFRIRGDAPLVMNKFSAKALEQMRKKQEAGSTGKKGAKREPKDFQAAYENAIHRTGDGWIGIPATALRAAMISACKIVGFHMTKGKLAVFVQADGFEADGTPLIRITKGEPFYHEALVRNETGVVDIRPRPMWNPGWEADVRVKYDADMFTLADVANLLMRAGAQVGILEGRPDSKKSTGQGWGTFEVLDKEPK
jgi:hypothetical protein